MKKKAYLVPSLRVVYLEYTDNLLGTAISGGTSGGTVSDDDDTKDTRKLDFHFDWDDRTSE